MKGFGRFFWMIVGGILGAAATHFFLSGTPRLLANSNDRYEDYIICTGPVEVIPKTPTDGVWVLDYKAGRLLGAVINKKDGKIGTWAEVDLVDQFKIRPKENVHFMMTTGTQVNGQTALYVAETVTGKFAVYTMGPLPDARMGVVIRRHDATRFRPQ